MNSEFQQEQKLVDSVMKTIREQISRLEEETASVGTKSFIFASIFGMKSK